MAPNASVMTLMRILLMELFQEFGRYPKNHFPPYCQSFCVTHIVDPGSNKNRQAV